MQVIYAKEEAPNPLAKSIFLVGPTPRSKDVPSWRPDALRALKAHGYHGTVFVPEPRDSWSSNFMSQVEWERQHLEMCDLIFAWVPRDLKTMPAFTTNVEFGRYITSGKVIYGRPEGSPKTRYLDWMYSDITGMKPFDTLSDMAAEVVQRLKEGAARGDGERYVPLHIWNTKMFQEWHKSLGDNKLACAKLLWSFKIPNTQSVFSYVLWVKVWIAAEQRFKENEYIFSRSDISVILPYWLDFKSNELLATKIVLVREFRLPVRNSSGYVHELPGGSSFKDVQDPRQVASFELKEETGLDISEERFKLIESRQLASTLSTHKAILFAVSLSDDEIKIAEELAAKSAQFGVKEDTERTYVEVKTLGDMLLTDEVDWSMIGMMLNGIAEHFGD